jgi:hypothetical protein
LNLSRLKNLPVKVSEEELIEELMRWLRRSREVTQVCSRKVTHQNDDLAQGKWAAWMPRIARRPARGWDKKTLRAFGADETASFIPCPWARPVLRMGHSIGAQVGHFS